MYLSMCSVWSDIFQNCQRRDKFTSQEYYLDTTIYVNVRWFENKTAHIYILKSLYHWWGLCQSTSVVLLIRWINRFDAGFLINDCLKDTFMYGAKQGVGRNCFSLRSAEVSLADVERKKSEHSSANSCEIPKLCATGVLKLTCKSKTKVSTPSW